MKSFIGFAALILVNVAFSQKVGPICGRFKTRTTVAPNTGNFTLLPAEGISFQAMRGLNMLFIERKAINKTFAVEVKEACTGPAAVHGAAGLLSETATVNGTEITLTTVDKLSCQDVPIIAMLTCSGGTPAAIPFVVNCK